MHYSQSCTHTAVQSISMLVIAVSSQGNELQPHSFANVSKATTTMTTCTTSSNNAGDRSRGDRDRIVSTLPPFPGDHGNISAVAAAAASAGEMIVSAFYLYSFNTRALMQRWIVAQVHMYTSQCV